MSHTVIIIPSRLEAKRLPNKPLKIIQNKEMILHVYDIAKKSGVGDVLVTTPDKAILDLITNNGGNAYISKKDHKTGTDRVFEAYQNYYLEKPKLIINLQGDMPNLNSDAIVKLNNYLKKEQCDMVTLSSFFKNNDEIKDPNIVKVVTKDDIKRNEFSEAIDFMRILNNEKSKFISHHIGIYGFTSEALMRYVKLDRSKLEIERKLEQMRALENKMKIHVGYINSNPLSVDTEKDLSEIKKLMEK